MNRIKQNEQYSDSWIYILLLTTLLILSNSIKTYNFNGQIQK